MATKRDEKRDRSLSPQQERAAELLAAGSTITAAAVAVEATRQTVSEWFNRHLGFQAAYNLRRRELWAEQCEQLRSLIPKALDVLAAALNPEGTTPDQRLRAAVAVLRSAGLHQLTAPDAPAELADLQLAADRREKEREREAFLTALI